MIAGSVIHEPQTIAGLSGRNAIWFVQAKHCHPDDPFGGNLRRMAIPIEGVDERKQFEEMVLQQGSDGFRWDVS